MKMNASTAVIMNMLADMRCVRLTSVRKRPNSVKQYHFMCSSEEASVHLLAPLGSICSVALVHLSHVRASREM